ncbi:MAG: hypothetical protein K2X82_21975 [Gemmataceae bacterium]|nr:hypothetical protein [Gemmataceae bacterium]
MLLHGRSSAATPQAPASPSRIEVSSPCCGHKAHPATPEQAPARPAPGDKCPCKHHSGDTPTTRAESAPADLSDFLRAAAPDLVAPLSLVADLLPNALRPAATARGASAPHLSTADLLFAHHNLRC